MGTHFGSQGRHILRRLDGPRYFAFRIVDIAEDHRPGGAGRHAGRFKTAGDTVDAERALVSDARRLFLVCPDGGQQVARIVGARNDARAASDAPVRPLQYETIGVLVGRFRRAVPDADRVIAVIAERRDHDLFRVRKCAPVLFLEPNPPHAKRQVEFHLARGRASTATRAPVQVDHHRVPLLARDTEAWRLLQPIASIRHGTP